MNLANFLCYMKRLITRKPETYSLKFDRIFYSLARNDIAIDCGANIGYFTEIMARSGARVFAFEPNPHAFEVLRQKFKDMENVRCLNKAVHVSNAPIKLYLHEKASEDQVHWSTGSSILASKGNVNKNDFVEVETIDLDAFIGDMDGQVALLKMDIEGAEVEVLDKLIKSGNIRKIKCCVVETHDHKIESLKEGTDSLRQAIKTHNLNNLHLDWY